MVAIPTVEEEDVLGIDPQEAPAEDETESASEDVDATPGKTKLRASHTAAPRIRDGSKHSQLIAMLRRGKGATIDQNSNTAPRYRKDLLSF